VPAALEGWPVVKPHRVVWKRVNRTPFFGENVWVQKLQKEVTFYEPSKIYEPSQNDVVVL